MSQEQSLGFDAMMEAVAQRTASIVLESLKPILDKIVNPEEKKVLTKEETMRMLGIKNPTTLWKWEKQKKLVRCGEIGGKVYFSREDVMAAMANKKHRA